ncbi:hypothetical protein BC834DRAFT_865599 [Gloeopeniophorella convolvens]|nr:hypothetical protein BC834DRAFT_865599 [Gloeopeniophorella convolvens]
MARFSARSPSMEASMHRRNRPAKKTSKTRRTPSLTTPRAPARNGKAKATEQRQEVPIMRSQLTYLYVGNLRSDVQNADLEKFFKPSGKAVKIDIRCGFGAGTAACNNTDQTVYATIIFASPQAAARAMEMHGRTLLGREIIVSPSFLDMPESKQGLQRQKFKLFGVNVKEVCGAVKKAVQRYRAPGTLVFPEEESTPGHS